MRALIVGAKGFVGAALTRELLGRGHDVVALEPRPGPGRLADVAGDVEWVVGDGSARDVVLSAIGRRGVEILYYGPFHRRAPDDGRVQRELEVMGLAAWDVFGLARVLPLRRILFPSSTAVHGPQAAGARAFSEETALDGPSLYAAVKLVGERVGEEVNREVGENVVVSLRLPSVYGPGADVASRGVNVFPVQAARGEPGSVPYSATARLCVAHTADTARALADLAEAPRVEHGIYELGGLDVSFGDIADAVRGAIPEADLRFGDRDQVELPHRIDASRLQAELDVRHRPLADGIASILAHEAAQAAVGS